MSNQTTTQKLSECRVCRDAGFPGTMIGFVKSDKVKPDGKTFWNLHNVDMTSHYHKSPTEKFQQIEKDDMKPPARPVMSSNEELTQEEIIALKQFVALMRVVK